MSVFNGADNDFEEPAIYHEVYGTTVTIAAPNNESSDVPSI